MSGKIDKFLAKSKKVKLGDEEIELKPLTVKNLDIIMDLGNENKKTEAMKRLIIETLKVSYPDEKPEDLENFSLEYFTRLTEAILEVNGLEVPKELKQAPLT